MLGHNKNENKQTGPVTFEVRRGDDSERWGNDWGWGEMEGALRGPRRFDFLGANAHGYAHLVIVHGRALTRCACVCVCAL